jgi:dolichol kinase
VKQESYKNELIRKAIHLSSLWIVITAYYFKPNTHIILLAVITALVLIIDIARRYSSNMKDIFNIIFGKILRVHETSAGKSLTGASYMMLSALFTFFVFPKTTAIIAFSVLIISDTMAALIGKRYGRFNIFGKTLEGLIAFIGSGFIIATFISFLYNQTFQQTLIYQAAVVIGALMELFSKKINLDDNLTIPIAIAGFVQLVNKFLVELN